MVNGGARSGAHVPVREGSAMALFKRNREPEIVIDLREPVRERPSAPTWGSPIPCPECTGRGYLDHIDPFQEIMYLHCTECGAKYERSKAQLEHLDS